MRLIIAQLKKIFFEWDNGVVNINSSVLVYQILPLVAEIKNEISFIFVELKRNL